MAVFASQTFVNEHDTAATVTTETLPNCSAYVPAYMLTDGGRIVVRAQGSFLAAAGTGYSADGTGGANAKLGTWTQATQTLSETNAGAADPFTGATISPTKKIYIIDNYNAGSPSVDNVRPGLYNIRSFTSATAAVIDVNMDQADGETDIRYAYPEEETMTFRIYRNAKGQVTTTGATSIIGSFTPVFYTYPNAGAGIVGWSYEAVLTASQFATAQTQFITRSRYSYGGGTDARLAQTQEVVSRAGANVDMRSDSQIFMTYQRGGSSAITFSVKSVEIEVFTAKEWGQIRPDWI